MKASTKKQNPPKGGTLTEEQIKWLNECTSDTWKLNPRTGLVDVDGSFHCSKQDLSDFKGVRFGVVEEDFRCEKNLLTSLVGAPRKVGGSFECDNNRLTSLEGAPREIGVVGSFYCYNNQLTSLEGAPQKVGWCFNCDNNQLTSLVGAPREVRGDFYCEDNLLTSLVGAPEKVGWCFSCRDNPVPERILESIFSLMRKGASYEEALREKWKRYSHKTKSLLYRAEYQWIPQEEHKMLSALNKVNSVLNWI